MSEKRPLRPPIDKYNALYWSALQEHALRLPKCDACGHLQFPMGPCCSTCLNTTFTWVELSGRGTVWSYIVYHHAFHPSLKDSLPYNVAEIQLEEGVRLLSNVVGLPNDAIRNNMPVQARFDRIDDELTLLRFEPISAGASVIGASP